MFLEVSNKRRNTNASVNSTRSSVSVCKSANVQGHIVTSPAQQTATGVQPTAAIQAAPLLNHSQHHLHRKQQEVGLVQTTPRTVRTACAPPDPTLDIFAAAALQHCSQTMSPPPGRITIVNTDFAFLPKQHHPDYVSAITDNSTNATSKQQHRKDVERDANYAAMDYRMKDLHSEAQIDEQLRNPTMKEKIIQYIKKTLIHELKFIDSMKDLQRLNDRNRDIGYEVMRNIEPPISYVDEKSWWLLYQNVVKKNLDKERNACFSASMRPDFIRKWHLLAQCDLTCDHKLLLTNLILLLFNNYRPCSIESFTGNNP